MSVIQEMGGALERIVVNDLRDNTFFAYLQVRMDGRAVEIDSRPSDALCIAVRTGSPIFVEEKVFELGSPGPPSF